MYLSIYLCLPIHTHVSKIINGKSVRNKSKMKSVLTYAQVNFALRWFLFGSLKYGCSDSPQTLRIIFPLGFTGVKLLRNRFECIILQISCYDFWHFSNFLPIMLVFMLFRMHYALFCVFSFCREVLHNMFPDFTKLIQIAHQAKSN